MVSRRLPAGGRIDRGRTLGLSFDGEAIEAHAGDTLASALLAADRLLVARSFKYHRPRGIVGAGVEEPNALVHLGEGARAEPNSLATTVEAFDRLVATSQNAWPSLGFDLGAVNGLFSRFLAAGFYYKTFYGRRPGTAFWMLCERFIRRAAGMGRAVTLDDPDRYEKINAFCDVLVVGAGPAGLAAALAAGRKGEDVVLVEQDFALGGSLLSEPAGGASDAWLAATEAELRGMPNVRILTRTTAFGAYDGGVFGCVERCRDHLDGGPAPDLPRQRYWLVRTGRTVLATGAIERPLVFAGNDVPGVMLASAARRYLNRHAVRAGKTVVVSTNNDSAYPAAIDLARAGAKVVLCDMRDDIPPTLAERARTAGIELRLRSAVLKAVGGRRVRAALVVAVDGSGRATSGPARLTCDLVIVSGGWAPALHLWSQRFGKPAYEPALGAFLPSPSREGFACAGSVAGAACPADAISQGLDAGGGGTIPDLGGPEDFWGRGYMPVTTVTNADGATPGKAFVDLQHDVKLTDIDQAHIEGFVSVEHLKRYTTSGMAADQGKTSNVNALSRMATLRGMDVPAVGTTTFRPPYTPVAIGAVVGHEHGLHFRPTRLSPIHGWHVERGAVMTEAGAWLRPWYYPKPGEGLREAYIREAAHVREHVGMVDVSTLGKIAVQGPDALEFLDRVYANNLRSLKVGRLRYGVMLREDGIVLDDGAVARLSEHDFAVSTTTANAAKVLATAEHLLQTAWRDLKVHVTTETDQWAAIAVAGPKSRRLLADVAGMDLGNEALPNNSFTYATMAGVPCRLHRMSYSGELAYEVYVPARSGRTVWEALYEAGGPHGVIPYGTEAMGALRIEKGHVAGAEIDGRTTLKDLGLEALASKRAPFVGSVLRQRPLLVDAARPTLVGLEIAGNSGAKAGSLLFSAQGPAEGHGEGWVSSATYSPALKTNIALGFLADGAKRMGETVRVVDFLDSRQLTARVVSPRFFDPEGHRQNG